MWSNFLLGAFCGCFSLFSANLLIDKISYVAISLIPLIGGIANYFLKLDITVVFPVTDILFCVAYAYFLVRFHMSVTRSVIESTDYDSNAHKRVIVFVAFVSFSIAGYFMYAFLPYDEWTPISWVWAVVNVLNLVFTLWADGGNIADYASVLLASTAALVRVSGNNAPYDSVTVIRFMFVTITILSPLPKLPRVTGEEFAFFAFKRKRTRIILAATLLSYFVVSPTAMWNRGDEGCPLIAILVPGMYALMLAVETAGVIQSTQYYG
jgi:hypothetical protein